MVCTAEPVGAGSDGERMVMAETWVKLVKCAEGVSLSQDVASTYSLAGK